MFMACEQALQEDSDGKKPVKLENRNPTKCPRQDRQQLGSGALIPSSVRSLWGLAGGMGEAQKGGGGQHNMT